MGQGWEQTSAGQGWEQTSTGRGWERNPKKEGGGQVPRKERGQEDARKGKGTDREIDGRFPRVLRRAGPGRRKGRAQEARGLMGVPTGAPPGNGVPSPSKGQGSAGAVTVRSLGAMRIPGISRSPSRATLGSVGTPIGTKSTMISIIPGPSQAREVFYYCKLYLFYNSARKLRKNSTNTIRTPDIFPKKVRLFKSGFETLGLDPTPALPGSCLSFIFNTRLSQREGYCQHGDRVVPELIL